jgi:hypothetical protein
MARREAMPRSPAAGCVRHRRAAVIRPPSNHPHRAMLASEPYETLAEYAVGE